MGRAVDPVHPPEKKSQFWSMGTPDMLYVPLGSVCTSSQPLGARRRHLSYLDPSSPPQTKGRGPLAVAAIPPAEYDNDSGNGVNWHVVFFSGSISETVLIWLLPSSNPPTTNIFPKPEIRIKKGGDEVSRHFSHSQAVPVHLFGHICPQIT